MPAPQLLKRDWQNDRVYLVQFPRAGCIPSLSPFALKLETWLRMTRIPYANVSNEFTKKSRKKQIPFIEINGRHIADSNLCIDYLNDMFKIDIDSKLSSEENARSLAITALLEDSLFWFLLFDRSKNLDFVLTDAGMIRHFSGIRKFIFRNILNQVKKKISQKCYIQGTGRLTPEEVTKKCHDTLIALSTFLSNKEFFLGSQETTVDATAFGHLAQFHYTPLGVLHDTTSFMEKETPNLVKFILRMKDAYWSDWDEAIRTLSLDTKNHIENAS